MKKTLLLAVLALISLSIGLAAESDYAEMTVSNVRLQWKVEGESLSVIVSAPTTGWVGVGFVPSQKMKDASIIIGYVKDGKAVFRDDFGAALTAHRPDESQGGKTNIADAEGSEQDGRTELKFTKDQELVPGKEVKVIMAYGPNGADVFTQYHAFRTTVTIKL